MTKKNINLIIIYVILFLSVLFIVKGFGGYVEELPQIDRSESSDTGGTTPTTTTTPPQTVGGAEGSIGNNLQPEAPFQCDANKLKKFDLNPAIRELDLADIGRLNILIGDLSNNYKPIFD